MMIYTIDLTIDWDAMSARFRNLREPVKFLAILSAVVVLGGLLGSNG